MSEINLAFWSEERVSDGAAEPERAHAGIVLTRSGACMYWQHEARRCIAQPLADERVEHTKLRVACIRAVSQQPLDLEQTHLSRRCLAVTHIRLRRTQRQWRRTRLAAVHSCKRTCLGRVAQRRACAMRLAAPDLRR